MNNKKLVILMVVIGVLLIPQFYTGIRDIFNARDQKQASLLRYPSLTLIESEINAIKPMIGPGLTAETIGDICALARGDISLQSEIEKLKSQKKDVEQMLKSDGPDSLLVSNNQKGRQVLCAAYIANLPYSFPAVEVMDNKSEGGKAGAEQKNNISINRPLLIQELQLRLAVLQVNAEVFSVMAASLSRDKGKTIQAYRQEIQQVFSESAASYLLKVKAKYEEMNKKNIMLIKFDGTELSFTSDRWLFRKDSTSTVLINGGTYWYGNNYLLGSQYYFDMTTDKLF